MFQDLPLEGLLTMTLACIFCPHVTVFSMWVSPGSHDFQKVRSHLLCHGRSHHTCCLTEWSAPRKSYSGGDRDEGLTCVWRMEDDARVGTDKLFQELHVLWGRGGERSGGVEDLDTLAVHNPCTPHRWPGPLGASPDAARLHVPGSVPSPDWTHSWKLQQTAPFPGLSPTSHEHPTLCHWDSDRILLARG